MIRIAGLAAILLGLLLDVDGLLICGTVYLVLGFIAAGVRPDKAGRALVAQAQREAVSGSPTPDGTAAATGPELPGQTPSTPPPVGRHNAAIALIMLTGGISVALGVFEVGFGEGVRQYRWIPIIFGLVCAVPFIVSQVALRAGKGILEVVGNPTHPALVTIEAIRETGTRINERPQFSFDLHVQPEGLDDYRVTRRMTTPYIAHGRLVAGATFQALIDPQRPKGMEVSWDTLTLPGQDLAGRLDRLDGLLADGTISVEEHAEQRQRILDHL